ncbi:unnamed protein product [Protopolystoma xenopodis]|uniref:Nuclear receptor domain-containing protein n=1 Tax=Protopolystoma xenopodis TaxID=117903 RepID=A0A3S4ZV75_9PLAT|nr:unnamed protein product [Protopolystoma xenopodis]
MHYLSPSTCSTKAPQRSVYLAEAYSTTRSNLAVSADKRNDLFTDTCLGSEGTLLPSIAASVSACAYPQGDIPKLVTTLDPTSTIDYIPSSGNVLHSSSFFPPSSSAVDTSVLQDTLLSPTLQSSRRLPSVSLNSPPPLRSPPPLPLQHLPTINHVSILSSTQSQIVNTSKSYQGISQAALSPPIPSPGIKLSAQQHCHSTSCSTSRHESISNGALLSSPSLGLSISSLVPCNCADPTQPPGPLATDYDTLSGHGNTQSIIHHLTTSSRPNSAAGQSTLLLSTSIGSSSHRNVLPHIPGPLAIDRVQTPASSIESAPGDSVPLPGFTSPESAFYQYQNKMEGQMCQVCGELAAGFHHGAYVCEACKPISLFS